MYDACEKRKSTRLFFKSRPKEKRSATPGKVLHADLCGPMRPYASNKSPGKQIRHAHHRLPLPIHDFIFLSYKDQAGTEILDNVEWVMSTAEIKTSVLKTDNGSELMSIQFRNALMKNKIKHQTIVHSKMAQPERANRTLLDRSRTMLLLGGLPEQYGQYAMSTAARFSNRISSSANEVKSLIKRC